MPWGGCPLFSWKLRCLVLGVVGLLCAGATARADDKAAGLALFETSIRPVLVKQCYQCHSAEAAKRGKLEAGLALDTRQGLLTGGESGPAIVPGNAKKSLLIAALKYESYEMPPSGRLPVQVIDKFVQWIDAGAPDPRGDVAAAPPRRTAFQITSEDRNHWAFQPVRSPAPPQVKSEAWVRRDLDRFVLAGLEKSEQTPNSPAAKMTLLRRATFSLTGLPPTPDEIAKFLADDAPDAFEKVVDRLLDSPEFGVQWGQRWLDGVRYSDSVDKSGAYRSWVIRAFNEDLPYDQFVKMQLAGDLLPAERTDPNRVHASGASLDGITATGMMSLAVWEIVGRDLAVAEIVDSQIDVVGRQLLGLTLACARCHDHKFDPISIRDYYAMAGIFFSSHIVTGKLIADDRLGNELIEVPLLNARQAETNRKIDQEIATLQARIDAVEKKFPKAARLRNLDVKLKSLEAEITATTGATAKKKLKGQLSKLQSEQRKLSEDQRAKGWDKSPKELAEILGWRRRMDELRRGKMTAPAVVATAEGGVPGSNREQIGDAPIYLRGDFQRPGAIAVRGVPTILAGDKPMTLTHPTRQSGRKELAEWIASPRNPLTARVMANRVWQQLIGQGIVRSPDNFGRLGEPPTHPELLDHLSHRFVASGWSVKRLVREIMLSATYQQSSLATPEMLRVDPENRLVGRMNRRRLTYEELRDSLLLLGGTLRLEDSPASSSSSAAKNRNEGIATGKGTRTGEKPTRRTIYEPVDRRRVNVTAAIFDGPDGKTMLPLRAETTTAPQALYLMNSPFVETVSRRIAAQLHQESSLKTDARRVEQLWLRVLGRRPDMVESTIARDFVVRSSWERFVHTLLASNEFVYID